MSNERAMLITGTSRGIGRYLANHYLERGDWVFGCSRGETDIRGDRYRHYCMDVTDEDRIRDLLADVGRQCGGLDVLINNAGIAMMNHSLLTPTSSAEKILRTNVIGSFVFSREAARWMRYREYGRIVNFTSVAAALKLEGEAIYAASKAAILCLTEIMARELAPFNITVNAVGPTAVDTDLIRGVPKDKMDRLLARQAIQRMGTFEDVANIVDFFIKPESAMITGQVLYLGGV